MYMTQCIGCDIWVGVVLYQMSGRGDSQQEFNAAAWLSVVVVRKGATTLGRR